MHRFIITVVTEVCSWNTLIRIAVYDKGPTVRQPLVPFLLSVAHRTSYCSKRLMFFKPYAKHREMNFTELKVNAVFGKIP